MAHEVDTGGRDARRYSTAADVDEFVDMLGRYERGEITSDAWRRFRLLRGTYGQRQADDSHMLRVKIPQGVLGGEQLHALADVAARHSRGFGHITTRQNLQFHFLPLPEAEAAMRRLDAAGLTTREACGNSVRNVTACPHAGVAPDEVFDVTPYAEALTRFLLGHPLSSVLPRKFKIAFEGCPEDHALTPIHDLGFTARIDAAHGVGRRGFRVTVGGGTAILCTSGHLLFEWLPPGEIAAVAEAVLRVYQRLGDFEHRQRNRLKFLIRKMGWEAWRVAFDAALAEVRAAGVAALPFDADAAPEETAPTWTRPAAPAPDALRASVLAETLRGPGIHPAGARQAPAALDAWRRTNLRAQKQAGYVAATVRLPLGDVTAAQLRGLAGLSAAYGDGAVRLTADQNVVLRWVREQDVASLHQGLVALGMAQDGAGTAADVTSCPGAETCRLAVTHSRGLGQLVSEHLAARPALGALTGTAVRISGCPNGCGQHHVAAIGFQGSVRKLDGRALPQYFVMAGGATRSDGAAFARLVAKVPARRAPLAAERLLALYVSEREGDEAPDQFFNRTPLPRLKALLADLEGLDGAAATEADFIDPGTDTAFVPEIGDGECAT